MENKNKKRNAITILLLVLILAALCLGIAAMVWTMTGHPLPFAGNFLSESAPDDKTSSVLSASSGTNVSPVFTEAVSESTSEVSAVSISAPAASETPTPTPEPTPDPEKYNTGDVWALVLVNKEHPLPDGYAPQVTVVENDQSTDIRCADSLTQMLADCRAAGYNPLAISGYRTHETQELYFNNTVQMYVNQGMDEASAEAAAATSVAIPGTSEHELGLSVDIGTTSNTDINSSQDNDPTQLWLQDNCWKYGYILRYPPEKSDLTGIIYESWHYRYVGTTASKVIHEENLCLEEYLQKYVEPFTSLEEINRAAMASLENSGQSG